MHEKEGDCEFTISWGVWIYYKKTTQSFWWKKGLWLIKKVTQQSRMMETLHIV